MNDRLTVYFDARVFDHDTGEGAFEAPPSPYLSVMERHPENGERIRNMESVLRKGPVHEALDWCEGNFASVDEMALFHDRDYLGELASIPTDSTRRFSTTTVFGPGSYEIIRIAAGLAIAAAGYVWQGKGKIAYAMSRPPGHHAQRAMADGYCFINNIGVAIETLRKQGMKRACVIDWDVHHGNGTQEGFYEDPDILSISLHMDHRSWGATHPQSGLGDEVGRGSGKGANYNIPLPIGVGNAFYLAAFDHLVAPAVRDHKPEIIFIAAGQDANQFDPNGRQCVNMEGFYQLGVRARRLADEISHGKLVLVQEGGYQMSYAAYCLHATLEGVLLRERGLDDSLAYMPDHEEGVKEALEKIVEQRNMGMNNNL